MKKKVLKKWGKIDLLRSIQFLIELNKLQLNLSEFWPYITNLISAILVAILEINCES